MSFNMTLDRLYSALVEGEITADEFSQLASAEFGLSDRTIDQLVDPLIEPPTRQIARGENR
jgi:hypothetical protein